MMVSKEAERALKYAREHNNGILDKDCLLQYYSPKTNIKERFKELIEQGFIEHRDLPPGKFVVVRVPGERPEQDLDTFTRASSMKG